MDYSFTISIPGFKTPDPDLSNISFDAYVLADVFYRNYQEGKKQDLERFISCFYYKGNKFRKKLIELNAHLIRSNCSISDKEAIADEYVKIRYQLSLLYPHALNSTSTEDRPKNILNYYFELIMSDSYDNQCGLFKVLPVVNELFKNCWKNGINNTLNELIQSEMGPFSIN